MDLLLGGHRTFEGSGMATVFLQQVQVSESANTSLGMLYCILYINDSLNCVRILVDVCVYICTYKDVDMCRNT